MSDKKDYFNYVVDVLGVKSILLNQDSFALLQAVPLLVSVENLKMYSLEENDLLVKMIGALKIDLQLIKVVDQKQRSLFQPEFTLYFQDNLDQNFTAELNVVQTYSPRFLLKNQQSKKRAWDDLQKVILYFSQ